MTEEQIALARRAVACKNFRWMPGMLTNHGARCLGRDLWVDRGERGIVYADPNEGEVPDLTDSATLGCLLVLVREAWNDPHASVWYDSAYWHSGNRWSWWAKEQSRVDYDTEAEALVAALEAAP